jgi:hypothetical protein
MRSSCSAAHVSCSPAYHLVHCPVTRQMIFLLQCKIMYALHLLAEAAASGRKRVIRPSETGRRGLQLKLKAIRAMAELNHHSLSTSQSRLSAIERKQGNMLNMQKNKLSACPHHAGSLSTLLVNFCLRFHHGLSSNSGFSHGCHQQGATLCP